MNDACSFQSIEENGQRHMPMTFGLKMGWIWEKCNHATYMKHQGEIKQAPINIMPKIDKTKKIEEINLGVLIWQ